MRRIGLTGGIASGKSAVAGRLEQLGAVVIDADRVAREVVEPGEPALAQIAEAFGPDVLREDGALDRAALGAIVFADREKLSVLNGITHPAIAERTLSRFAAAEAADPRAVVVYDVPLLVEGSPGRSYGFDTVVVVEAAPEERVRRMVELRGMDRAEAERRIASQASDADRRAVADHVIDANGSLEHTLEQVDALWPALSSEPASQAPHSTA
jgi:dephospho-CoA kinase